MRCSLRHAAILLMLAVLGMTSAAVAQVPGLPSLGGATEAEPAPEAAEPSLDDLIAILENEATRKKLLDSLKAAAYAAPAGESADVASPASETGLADRPLSVPAQIARWSQAFIASAFGVVDRVAESSEDAEQLLSGAGALDIPRISDAILPVVLVAVVVFAVYAGTRLARNRIFTRMAARAKGAGPLVRLLLLAASSAVDLLAIVLSSASGYVAAIVFFGGPPNINQALFLNAFLVIEVVKAAFGAFVAPRHPELRMTPFGDTQARYWYFWISRLISILGYTFLFAAPIVAESSSVAAADAVRFIVAFLSLCLVIFLILQNRTTVRDRLRRSRLSGDKSVGARFYALLGHVWWILAIGFVLALFSVWLSSPQEGLRFMTFATLKSILAMVLGGLVVTLLTRLIISGIPVPDTVKEKLPLLERRVNSFIPNALTVIRVIVVITVLGVVLEAWNVFDFSGWTQTEFGQRVVSGLIGAGVVIFLGFGVFLAISSWVEYRLNPNFGRIPTARERTLLALFRNGFTITILVITVMLVLSQIGINIGPLLAGAGVLGLAVGFGAQKLVQDIITGAFIQLENAMNEGDVVLVAGVSGTVERLTIRSVGLRALDGTYHLIPFSSVDQVANMTKDFSQVVADIGVAYRENTDDVKALMRDAYAMLKDGDNGVSLIGDFEMFGVNELGASAVVVRGRIKTLPGKQWAVGRAYNKIVKHLCDERGIELAFPNTTIWFGEDKRGNAPALNLKAPLPVAAPATDASVPPEPLDTGPVLPQRPDAPAGAIDSQGKRIPPHIDDLDGAAGSGSGR